MKKLLYLLVCVGLGSSLEATEPVSFQVGEFTFERPEGWSWVPASSQMRKAQLSVAGSDGALGEVVFFHFGPGQGGSVEDNVNRWVAQFENPENAASAKETLEGRNVTFVRAEGTYLSGMPGTPTTPLEGFALRGAILESPQGDVYVKFTGPQAVVEQASSAFEQMVRQAVLP